MAIHDDISAAVRRFKGQILETAQIIRIVQQEFPKTSTGSILPNDHATGNANPCWCANTGNRIFDKVGHGKYKVR